MCSVTRASPPRAFAVFMFGLYASIVLIFLAGDVVLFLLAWEVMSILCWLLIVCAQEKENGHAGAGYLLLAMGEAGTLTAALGFLLLAVGAGSLDFGVIKSAAPGLGAGVQWAVFLLSFFGFGVKAGLVPVNSWLPPRLCRRAARVCAGAGGRDLEPRPLRNFARQRRPHAGDSCRAGLVALVVGTLSALV